MIYCNLKGGLGNMLFQIAATKTFSLIKNVDFSFPNFDQHINYLNSEIGFNSKLNYAEEYKLFLNLNTHVLHQNIKCYNYPFNYSDFIPNENIFAIDGFFQSEKYFINFRKEILELIKPNEEINKILTNKYTSIINSESISLHVRRGDYVKLPEYHPTQEIEYYNKCLSNLTKYDILVIFSDDIEWCKKNFQFKNMFFVENEKDYIEMFLMSKCKNNIIANSSFSWWGAWLNQNNDKIVVAPKKWFGHNLSHLDTKDVYPDGWIIV